jgi:hypothetical protein
LWLGTLRTLSPGQNSGALPAVARTEAWGRRLLNTQMASWAELRHDTILYVKQSYTAGAACEYPDAYVDPYPKFFEKLQTFAARGDELVSSLTVVNSGLGASVGDYFGNLNQVAQLLKEMAENQQAGTPHTDQHLAFINQAVTFSDGCGEPTGHEGWYAQLFFSPNDALEMDPVVADVHTQPTDEVGNPVGKVLHVGTGLPRMMVVTAENCSGARAYVGLVSTYLEKVTQDFERLDDEQWKTLVFNEPDVPWMKAILTTP